MWKAVCFFLGIILILLGLWLYSTAFGLQFGDPSNGQKRVWAFVSIIIGFFLLLLCASCGNQLGGWGC